MSLHIEGLAELRAFAEGLGQGLSPSSLTAKALELAEAAGIKLKGAVVEQCVRDIYDLPMISEGYERTEALMNSHEMQREALEVVVQIDPSAPALWSPHKGRVEVMDYALAVHDGYTQWYMGHNTGVWHEGRPWFDNAIASYGEEIFSFVMQAFFDSCVATLERS